MRPVVQAECTLKESAAINQILGRRVSNIFVMRMMRMKVVMVRIVMMRIVGVRMVRVRWMMPDPWETDEQ